MAEKEDKNELPHHREARYHTGSSSLPPATGVPGSFSEAHSWAKENEKHILSGSGGFLVQNESNENAAPIMDVVTKEERVLRVGRLRLKPPDIKVNYEEGKKSVSEIRTKDGSIMVEGIRRPADGKDAKMELAEKILERIPKMRDLSADKHLFSPEKKRHHGSGHGVVSRYKRFVTILASLAGLTAAFFILSYAMAGAVISLRPKITTVPVVPTAVIVDPKATAVNITAKKLPGLYLEVPKSVGKDYESKTVSYTESRSRGFITIFNEFSAQPQVLVEKTRFEPASSPGLIFRLQEKVVVPGYAKQNDKIIPGALKAEVLADEPGEKYNIGLTDFTIPAFKGSPRFSKVFAKSIESFRGGLKGAGAVVTAEELKPAEEAVTAQVFEEAKKELSSKIPPGFLMLPGARNILITGVSKPQVGEAARTYTVSADAVASAMLFKEKDLFLLFSKLFLKEENKENILGKKSDISYSQLNFDADSKTLSFSVGGKLVVGAFIDEDGSKYIEENELKKELAGLAKKEAEGHLRSRKELSGFTVEISPPWAGRLPSNPDRIKIKVEQ